MKYAFTIERREYADREGRDLVIEANKGCQTFTLPALSKEELKDLAQTISNFL